MSSKNTSKSGRSEFVRRLALTQFKTWNIPLRRFGQKTPERDRKKREELLHKIQQKVYDDACVIPMWQLGFLCVTGPRVAVSGLGLIPGHIYSAPYEDVQLKS